MEAVGPTRRGTNPSAAASRDAARDSAESNDRVESETSSHVSEEGSDGDEGDEDEDEDDDDDEDEADEDENGDDSPFKLLERQAGAGTDDAEFYSSMIQMLTHVLGSSEAAISWPYQATPGSQLAPSPFGQYGSSPAQTPSQGQRTAVRNIVGSKAELSALQPLIQALIARLSKDQQLPRRPVGEQDLTALLQTLMEQQQRQQKQEQQKPRQGSAPQANAYSASSEGYPQQGASTQAPSNRSSFQDSFVFGQTAQNGYQSLQFADLDFEDEDEDDPDFNPDLNPDLPLPSAWSLAVRDVVASEQSRAAAASHSGTPSGAQTPADQLRPDKETTTHSHMGLTGRSPTRQSTMYASTSTFAQGESPFSVPDITFSPSGRPIRASRKRQGSPTPSSHSRQPRTTEHNVSSRDVESSSFGRRNSTQPLRPVEYAALQSPGQTFTHSSRQETLPQLTAREESSVASPAISPPAPLTQATTQQAETDSTAPRKRGRKPVLEPGEAQRRRAQRNVEYQRMRRQVKKAEESEQSETVLELKAEVKMLRAEMERLRDENAMLRAQRELDRLQRSGPR